VITALVDHFTSGRVPGQRRALDFTPWGGAYNRLPPDATTFVHRAERFLLKHDVATYSRAFPAEPHRARRWLTDSWRLVHPSGSGGVYSNFPDPDLGEAQSAYYGRNLERLLRVKKAYDPDNLLRFDQSLADLADRQRGAAAGTHAG
jgi:Berberine and berberine like